MNDYQREKISQQDWMLASGLFLLGLITRIPFASRMLFHSDSTRLALAMEHYDVAQMRPQAPGYILYVAAAKLMDLFIHDSVVSMVAVSILSSALTVFFFYFLALKMFGRSNAVIGSLLLIGCPLFWFNGEMPLTYALEGLFIVVFTYACYQMIIGERKWWIVASISIALATGVRQHLIIIFLPLWFYALKNYSFRKIFYSLLIFGLICLAWFVPMIALTGGMNAYFSALNAQFKVVVLHPAPFLFQMKVRGIIFVTFLVYSLTIGLFPMLYYFGRFFRIQSIIKDIRMQFLSIWLVPPCLLFVFGNVYNSGQVLIVLPPLFIFLAESIRGLAGDMEDGLHKIIGERSSHFSKSLRSLFSYNLFLVTVVILLLFINSYIFLFGNTRVSYAAIRESDNRLAEQIRLTEENFIPEKTMILALFSNTQAGFYLPDYLVVCPFPMIFHDSEVPLESQNVYTSHKGQTNPKTYWIPTGFRIEPVSIPEGVETLIVWEKDIAQYYQNASRPLDAIESDRDSTKIYFLRIQYEEKIYYYYHSWFVR